MLFKLTKAKNKKTSREISNTTVEEKEILSPDIITPVIEDSEKKELIFTRNPSLTSSPTPHIFNEENVVQDNVYIKPSEIYSTLQKLPPYQRDAVKDSYLGQKIKMDLNFENIIKLNNNSSVLIFSEENSLHCWIHAEVNIEDYPQFKILPKNTILNVEGEISSFEGYDILINIIHFSFYNDDYRPIVFQKPI